MTNLTPLKSVVYVTLAGAIVASVLPWSLDSQPPTAPQRRGPASVQKGYTLSPKKLARNYPYTKRWKAVLEEITPRYGQQLPVYFPKELNSIKDEISKFAEKEADGYNPRELEKKNGIKFDLMSERIIRSAYCFGLDPFVLAAKIKRETRFHMDARPTSSPTSAAGLTQMTIPAIKEVNLQLQPRDSGTDQILKLAFNCVTPEMRTMIEGTNGVSKQQWLLGRLPASGATRLSAVDRQITYGAALLKIYLAKFGNYLPALSEYGPPDEAYAPSILSDAERFQPSSRHASRSKK